MNCELENLTIKSFHHGLVNKQFKVKEIVEEYFDNIEKKDKEIKAYLCLRKEKALQESKEVDKLLEKKEEEDNLLLGLPLAIKDNILIKGEKTTAASKILRNYIASYDASVISRLKQKKVIFLGKTNLDEFAMGSSTENSAFFTTHNPHNLDLVPGGSSGGSTAAVSSNMALAALGSDTGGSIRQPASFCGVVGIKPTYGLVSRFGLIAMGSSLDQIGPIAKTVEDTQILFDALKGKDPLDPTTVTSSIQHPTSNIQHPIIGLPKEFFEGIDKEVEKSVKETIEELNKKGIKFKEISFPFLKYALPCYYIIMPAEACSNLARYDGIRYSQTSKIAPSPKRLWRVGDKHRTPNINWKEYIKNTRSEGFGEEVKRRLILGTFVLSHGYYDAYYVKASKLRNMIKKEFKKIFEQVDAILTPTSPTLPFKIGEKVKDPLAMYLSDIFTVPANLTGLPAISIPCKKNKLVGFQLMGRPFEEEVLFELGKLYEK